MAEGDTSAYPQRKRVTGPMAGGGSGSSAPRAPTVLTSGVSSGPRLPGGGLPGGGAAAGPAVASGSLGSVTDQIQKFSGQIAQFESLVKEIGGSKDTQSLRSRIREHREGAKVIGKNISDSLRTLRVGPEKEKFNRLVSQYDVILGKFQESCRLAARKEREAPPPPMDSYGTMDQPRTPGDSSAPLVAGREDPEMALQQKLKDRGLLSTEYTLREEQNKEIQSVETDVLDLQDMYVDLATVVNEQQKDLDLIEEQVHKAGANVNKGVEEIKKASEYQKKSRKKMCCLIICILIIVALAVTLPMTLLKK